MAFASISAFLSFATHCSLACLSPIVENEPCIGLNTPIASTGCEIRPSHRCMVSAPTLRTGFLSSRRGNSPSSAPDAEACGGSPQVGGSHRDPLPRSTVLTDEQKQHLRDYFRDWARPRRARRSSASDVPGAAATPIPAHYVQGAMAEAGDQVWPALLRLDDGFRGGDRPKNAETELP